MFTSKAGVKSDPPKVIIEPTSEKKPKKETQADILKKIIEQNTVQNPELPRYIKLWGLKDGSYRRHSPGEQLVDLFLELSPPKGATIIDWGCGTGRASKKMYDDERNFDITMVDFAYNCLDDEIKELAKDNDRLRFMEKDITKNSELQSEWGFCTDVLEHIEPDDIDAVLDNILTSSKQVFFQISTANDIFSNHPEMGDGDLHLTVQNYNWWLRKFSERNCIIHRSKELNNAAIFFVTAWSERILDWTSGKLNTDTETIKANMAENAKLGLKPIVPHVGDGETEVMLLCGGPTLNDFEDEIKEKRAAGVKCITVNGTYNWCLDRNIKPSLQCMLDARPFMKRMVEQVPGLTDETKYAISSQCNPEVFEGMPHDRTYIWQASTSIDVLDTVKEHYGKMYEDWFPSPGGSTVGLRAIWMLRILGFNKIHVYGMDSCLIPDRDHHAYEQKENDNQDKDTVDVIVGKGHECEKTFKCTLWQAYQAAEFQKMIPHLFEDLKLQFYGDGLIAEFVRCAAEYGVSLEMQDAASPPE
jgi:2-polyprenyl-3-methyl-5-hydroxy-6-metoxy-1,4-benzoquinol methylase